MPSRQANRLIHETSPYLRQHAHNPVDWYPWGEEALSKAKRENKPILLSIGYSACHWCHVMEQESFEDEAIAELMNQNFVNIKVDREERPDLDRIYQSAVQLFIRRGGGWPLTIFLTPDQVPFYGGTYFPPEERYGIPSFERVLRAVDQIYREKPEDISQTVREVRGAMVQISGEQAKPTGTVPLDPDVVARAATGLSHIFDHTHGGFGGAPKFPSTMALSLFLRHYHQSNDTTYLERVKLTLRKMAEGGIYDQLGGGFHRYSTDPVWLVPHFEKMLYDNAQLVPLYLSVYRITREPFYRRIAEETLRYVLREMVHPEGGFYSTQDADSEGVEGKFFVWTKSEVTAILGQEEGDLFCRYYDVSGEGNWEGKSILRVADSAERLSQLLKSPAGEIIETLERGKAKLFAEREKRIKPHRDEKVLASWNGLMIQAFADAYAVLGEKTYREAAERAADFIFKNLYRNGRLLRTWKDGEGKLNAYLDDYAYLANALLELYQVTFEPKQLDRAKDLVKTLNDQFWDDEGGGYFFTARDHEPLIARFKSALDESVPSGNSVAAQALLTLYHHTGERDYLDRAERLLKLFFPNMDENPFGYGSLLNALDFYFRKPKEIVLIGEKGDPAAEALLREIHKVYLPNRTLIAVEPGAAEALPEPVRGKGQVDGKPTVYVCQNFTCSLPVTTVEEALSLLKG
jgi:uncharacterized protein YyaL (SSP411 family)